MMVEIRSEMDAENKKKEQINSILTSESISHSPQPTRAAGSTRGGRQVTIDLI
jgi:hypothetical protein